MKFNVYGKKIEVTRKDDNWRVFYLGNEGKKRSAENIVIPSSVKQHQLKAYLADICHEWATKQNDVVKEI